MTDPADPMSFLRTLSQAEAKTAGEAWEEAAALWARVVEANPVEGRFWTCLAETSFHAKDFAGAIAASERALELRDGYPAETAYRVARCKARLGEQEQTLVWLERALGMGYRDLDGTRTADDFVSLRDDARFRELVGLVDPSAMTRDEGWRSDLRLLAREIRRRAYDPFRHLSEARFDAAVADLHRAIPELTDSRIVVELQRLVALLGDAHAGVLLPREQDDHHLTVPLQFYLFVEGLFVTAADPKYAALLGAQVLRIEETPVEAAIEAIAPLIGLDNGNTQWVKHVAPYRLRETPTLHALGLIAEPGRMTLTLRGQDGQERTIEIAANTSQSNWKLRRARPCPEGWAFLPENVSEPRSLCLRNAGIAYWFEYLPTERVVYFQFNQVLDHPRESLADFTERLFAFIDDQPVEKLVLDLRRNGGGNTYLELPLLHRLIGCRKVNRWGRLFVVIGRATFSAAQNGACLIDRHTEAIFVGEPTGSSPTFVGESIEFELPYSKLWANVSDLLWQSSWPEDYRIWLAPTLYTPPTFADFLANRDPALEAILAWDEHLPGR